MALTKPQRDEIVIPSSELPKFKEAIEKLADLEAELDVVYVAARELVVKDRVTYEQAAEFTAKHKSTLKESDAEMVPFENIVKKVADFIKQRKLRVKNRCEEIKGMLQTKMDAYVREEERKAKAERDRIQNELDAKIAREAEEKRQADEKAAAELKQRRIEEIRADLKAKKISKREAERLLKEAGALEEAAKAKAAADADEMKDHVPQAEVKPNVPAAAGVTRRTNYYAECKDPDAFLREFAKRYLAGDPYLREFVTVSDQALSAKAREMKDSDKFMLAYPFVNAWDEKTF